ncbi:hypothetical protein A3C23_04960 [Candidatus Roizmanbacteria bacterium RIFCSPHIGHO2_02_FULL_37_13b]|uniref:Cytidyltransferase-like domain-containing protein n=1 Tax=Candidatus Roizmanbacteria bacterium RIFCSPLOWO2_02_FULL_36_11 TaxID=1802071 RepID=A0A1F7JCU2_9BACT|nr:MAG: hypothetical protein A3C23_04960 [Candidatus Roizmanbacteria bacterium RIFCSPHIGHO2_02_FULL_37_13b]OGK53426.1 MAG: hypothetical protein A3H78_02735 [Candidatus Roizmanbacteria bacterium RIFCSPLOWO2_02_FULL_36_11]
MKSYPFVCVAGTFDHFHIGHEAIIDKAFNIGAKVAIGIATEKLYNNKVLSRFIQSFNFRKSQVKTYLKKRKYYDRVVFFRLDDIYGPAGKDKSLQALVISRETQKNAEKVNIIRKKNGLPILDLITIPLLLDNGGEVITSERIRLGLINRNGEDFITPFKSKTLLLPEELKSTLRKPLGLVFRLNGRDKQSINTEIKKYLNDKKPAMIITIGDIITSELFSLKIPLSLSVIDFKNRRRHINLNSRLIQSNGIKIDNPPGTISNNLIPAFTKAINIYVKAGRRQQIIINGEEDLTALIAVLCSPLQSIVLYGHYDLGVIAVNVDERVKEKVRLLISRFNIA